MSTLSVIINTKNSERFLEECLQSVETIADEIVMVDMASVDQTRVIASRYAKVKLFQYPNPEVGFADPAREFAFGKANGDWLLIIDSDERMPEKLAGLVRQIVDGKQGESVPVADAYFIARHNEIFGKMIDKTGWYPDYQMRLWRRGQIKWRPQVHTMPEILGTSAYLPADKELAVVHHNYQTVQQFVERANKYTTFGAEKLATSEQGQNWTPRRLWQSFFGELWRRGFQEEGLLEGNHGVVLSLLQASCELITSAKAWEAEGFTDVTLTEAELKQMWREWQREANYWWADLQVRQTNGLKQWYWRLKRKMASKA